MRPFFFVLVFASLVAETSDMFAKHWRTPLRLLSAVLFEYKPLLLPVIDLILLALWLFSSREGPKLRSRGLERAIGVATMAMLVWSVWGIARGGLFYQIQFQLHAWGMAFVCALLMHKILYTPAHFYTFAKVVIAAALIRAVMCIAFYVLVLREGVLKTLPEFITTHDDTVLFVSAIMAVVINAIERPTGKNFRLAAGVGVIMLLAIQFNNRRLAWVSLGGSLLLSYLMIPAGTFKRRLHRAFLMATPVLLLYVVLGWGRPESVFKPLRALDTVSGEKDPSTLSRDAENQGLLVTLTKNPTFGTGWGHEYLEVDSTLSAGTAFKQYRYLPHNSVLALLAFAGMFGFAATWMVFPISAYLSARAHRYCRDPLVRSVALMSLCEVVICISQWWGDMGMISFSSGILVAAAFAAGSRMSAYEDGVP